MPYTLNARLFQSQIIFDPAISYVVNSQFGEAGGISELGARISEVEVGQKSHSLIFSEMINIELQWANVFGFISSYRHCCWKITEPDWEDEKSLSVAKLSNDIPNVTLVETYLEDALVSY